MIDNFTYSTPTKLIFGKGVIKDLASVIGRYGKNVLLTYGGGSIKKMGLYDEVYRLLNGFNIVAGECQQQQGTTEKEAG